MNMNSLRFVTLALFPLGYLTAQTVDDTQLKQVIIFGRHSVRSPVLDNSTLDTWSVLPFPAFQDMPGILTSNGATLETILGGYYRLWLKQEKLLTGNDPAYANLVYFRANSLERTIATANAFATGLLPGAKVNVNSYQQGSDPLFNPVGAGVALLDSDMAIAAVKGRLGGNPQSLASTYAAEYALTRSLLLNYSPSQNPVPAPPAGTVDVTTIPIAVTEGTNGSPLNLGGLTAVLFATDPFVMEYADGMPASDVGWGQLTAGGISQTSRITTLVEDLLYRTPYLDQIQSSNVASHVVRSMVQAATGNPIPGTLGTPATKVILLLASDVNVTGLAGLFHMDWLLPGYQPDFCAPGGALVFQLRQSQSTGEYIVRTSYIAQTMDQLRNQTALTLTTPPASAPVFIPGCSVANSTFDCPLGEFVNLEKNAIDPQSVYLVN